MECSALTELKKYLLENISGMAAFLVSALSLYISWLAYKKDDPRLDLNIYAAQVWDASSGQLTNGGLAISIANIGKNPIKLSSLGGSCNFFKIRTFLSRILGRFTPKRLEPHEFIFDSPETNLHLRSHGAFITIPAGDRITFMIDDPKGTEFGKHLSKNSSTLHIFDAIGNKHSLSKARFSKLKRDYKNR
jgi:hypothetical protein